MDEQLKQIGERLRGLRDVLDIPVSEMAETIGIDPEKYEKIEAGVNQALDKLRSEINTVAPHDCTSLNFEIFEQVQVRKLLNNRSVIILDNSFKINDTTAPIIERDGYLVISNVFCIKNVKHRLY